MTVSKDTWRSEMKSTRRTGSQESWINHGIVRKKRKQEKQIKRPDPKTFEEAINTIGWPY